MTELYGWHFSDLVEKGDFEAARAIAATHVSVAQAARQPFMLAVGLSSETLLAMHEGRFADAEALAQETLKVGRRFSRANAAGAYGMQMFSIRREQGRLAEVLPVLRQFVATQAEIGRLAAGPGGALHGARPARTGAGGVRAAGRR